jgi:predicted nucleic acid-binding Zn ribbon protein
MSGERLTVCERCAAVLGIERDEVDSEALAPASHCPICQDDFDRDEADG